MGLPIAFGTCWFIGAPILRKVMRRPVSWKRAALWGGTIAAAIKVVDIALSRFRGWLHSRDNNFDYQIGGGNYIQNIDGILTGYGWWVVAQNAAIFILYGIVIALIDRAMIGSGLRTVHDDAV